MFSNVKLTGKLVGAVTLIFAIASGMSFWIMQSRNNRQEEEAFRNKLRQITGMASATRNWLRAILISLYRTTTSSIWSRSLSWFRCGLPISTPAKKE